MRHSAPVVCRRSDTPRALLARLYADDLRALPRRVLPVIEEGVKPSVRDLVQGQEMLAVLTARPASRSSFTASLR